MKPLTDLWKWGRPVNREFSIQTESPVRTGNTFARGGALIGDRARVGFDRKEKELVLRGVSGFLLNNLMLRA